MNTPANLPLEAARDEPSKRDEPARDALRETARETAKIVEFREQKDAPDPSSPAARDDRQTVLPQAQQAAPRNTQKGRALLRATLMLAGIALTLLAAGVAWLRGGRYVSTDNSYIRAAKLMVSTDVSGIVATVNVKQGDEVEKDRILFQLDPRQFEIALSIAQAQLDQVRLTVEAARRDYQRLRSDIAAQDALAANARGVFERAAELAKRNAGSQAAYDHARFALAAEENRLKSLHQGAQVALTRLGGDADIPIDTHPQFLEAKARAAEARRQLDRTIVRAPFAGIVTSVESLQPGTFLVAATAALTNTGAVGLIAKDNIWIEANMKETDLTFARNGNRADIVIDTYPGRVWKGHVETIFPATTSEFSILPAQNAGGNWVKVVQRIPVRIALERQPGDPPLRAGMSTFVTIDTEQTRGINDLWSLLGVAKPPVDLGWMERLAATGSQSR